MIEINHELYYTMGNGSYIWKFSRLSEFDDRHEFFRNTATGRVWCAIDKRSINDIVKICHGCNTPLWKVLNGTN